MHIFGSTHRLTNLVYLLEKAQSLIATEEHVHQAAISSAKGQKWQWIWKVRAPLGSNFCYQKMAKPSMVPNLAAGNGNAKISTSASTRSSSILPAENPIHKLRIINNQKELPKSNPTQKWRMHEWFSNIFLVSEPKVELNQKLRKVEQK